MIIVTLIVFHIQLLTQSIGLFATWKQNAKLIILMDALKAGFALINFYLSVRWTIDYYGIVYLKSENYYYSVIYTIITNIILSLALFCTSFYVKAIAKKTDDKN